MSGYSKPLFDSELFGCLVVLLFLSAALSFAVPVAQAENTTVRDAEAGLPTTIEDIDEVPKMNGTTTTAAADTTEKVVVEARDELTPERLDELRSKGASVESKHDRLVKIEINSGEITKYTGPSWVENVRQPLRPVPKALGDGAESIGAEEAHAMGVTGDGASVAVIDLGFNPDNDRIADNVVEQKTFGTGGIGANQPRHGTASAEMVIDVAPDADLYLASVSTGIGYMNAVDWATQNDVDVITTSLGFTGLPNDGTSDVSLESDDAVENGAVFTASSGNSARLHWQDSFSDTRGNDILEFGSGDYEVNFFTDRNGNPTEIPAGSVLTLVTTWDDWDSVSTNYNLHLVRVGSLGEQPQIVRSADTDVTGFMPVKRITAQAPQNGFYGVVVEQTEGTDETVEIFASSSLPRAGLQYNTPESSVVAPSTAEEVMGIAAFRYNTRNIEPYSSRGPTNDGRRGISVAAPTCSTASAYSGPYCGTSGAAPHAGGVAALVASTSDLGASDIRSVIQETADGMSEAVRARGDGALNASAAVREVMEQTAPEPVTVEHPDTAITGGEVELTVNTGEFATAAVEANSDDFGVDISVIDDGGDAPSVVSDERIEFIDIDEESSTYVLNVNVTGGTKGDTGTVSAYVGGNADEGDSDSSTSSTFSLIDATSSPVQGVSDGLWTAVTQHDGEAGLSLNDLGNAIQSYQSNPGNAEVGGVDIGLSDLGSLIQHYQNAVA